MTEELKEQLREHLQRGDRDGAILHLQNAVNVSFEDATRLIDLLEKESSLPAQEPPNPVVNNAGLDEGLKIRVAELLRSGRKAEALQLMRASGRLRLRDALVLLEQLAREANPNYVSFRVGGCAQMIAKGAGVFLIVVSIMFLAAGGIIYFLQHQSVSRSDRIGGVVTDLKYIDTGGAAPVVEFQWRGNKRSFESTYYVSPPEYTVGQNVFLFVNREDPEDILLDTFSDRFALITGLGVIGGFLLLVGSVLLYFGRRKF